MAESKPNLNYSENDKSLQYKDHNEFFEIFFQLRKQFLRDLHEFYINQNETTKSVVIGTMLGLIRWTGSQLGKVLDVNEMRTKVIRLGNSREYPKLYLQLDDLFLEISKAHESCELIPKIKIDVEDENAKFWKDEEHRAIREIKKGFYDILMQDG